MPQRRPSEICFFCPEDLYQALVRELSKGAGRSAISVERGFSRIIEILLTRLVEHPERLAELLRQPTRRPTRRPSRAPASRVEERAKPKRKSARS